MLRTSPEPFWVIAGRIGDCVDGFSARGMRGARLACGLRSALVDVRWTWCPCSFDDFVGTGEERGWDCEAEGLCGPEIDHEFEFCWLFHRKIAGLRAFQDFVNVAGNALKKIIRVRAIGDEASGSTYARLG